MAAEEPTSVTLAGYRAETIESLHGLVSDMVMRPLPGGPRDQSRNARTVEALAAQLGVYEALVKVTSTSNPGYEMKDLPQIEQRYYERARHALKILDLLYVEPTRPQAQHG